nr:hypothetical protein CFP56_32777 [Quercus suber]
MENTSPPIPRPALFLDQLRGIDRAIKKFDILKEEKKEKESHVINSQGVSTSQGGPQSEHNINLGPERRLGAHIAFERCGGATNTTDGPTNSLALPKETISPQMPSTEHKEARTLAQNSTSIPSNTFIPEGGGHTLGNQLIHNKGLGKENITTVSAEEARANGGQGAKTLGTWKQLPRESVEEKDRSMERRRSVSRGRTRCHSKISSRTFLVKKGTRWRHRFRLWVS